MSSLMKSGLKRLRLLSKHSKDFSELVKPCKKGFKTKVILAVWLGPILDHCFHIYWSRQLIRNEWAYQQRNESFSVCSEQDEKIASQIESGKMHLWISTLCGHWVDRYIIKVSLNGWKAGSLETFGPKTFGRIPGCYLRDGRRPGYMVHKWDIKKTVRSGGEFIKDFVEGLYNYKKEQDAI